MLALAPWPGTAGYGYAFTGRAGGRSRGAFASLNLSENVGDDPRRVRANWDVVRASLPDGARLPRLRQEHGAAVRRAAAGSTDLGAADAAFTTEPNVAVSVLTADCVPILLCASRAGVVAAVHAGWRGTAADVVGATVREIARTCSVVAEDVAAVLGPAIGPCCYTVGRDVAERLQAVAGDGEGVAVAERNSGAQGEWYADLRAVNVALLRRAGVPAGSIHVEGPCTRCAADDYFSHRAAAGRPTGRQAALVLKLPT